MMKKSKTGLGYNQVSIEQSDPANPIGVPKEERYCNTCNRGGHTMEFCFMNTTCKICGVKGHPAKFCRKRDAVCAQCGKVGHEKVDCQARCRMCNKVGHVSVTCPAYLGEEPARVPCSKCEEKIHLRLYHPTNKCANFKKYSKNGQ